MQTTARINPKTAEFETHRAMLENMAYRMLGSVSESEDVVQEAWFRWQDARRDTINSPRAFLAAIVSRLCIDRLRRRKVEKLNYTGPWLPEPVLTDEDPGQRLSLLESVRTGLLLVMEQLSPLERAVFVLREAFDLSHGEIAELLDISVAYSRQLARRAKLGLSGRTIPEEDDAEVVPLVEAFFEAAESGDMNQLHALLTEDVIAYSDGGGRATAALIPLVGPERVATVFHHLIQKRIPAGTHSEWIRANHQWALRFTDDDGIHSLATFEVKEGKLNRIYLMRNPDKLQGVREDSP